MSLVLEPMPGRVLFKPDEAPDKTRGGLHLPDRGRRTPARGTILAVGPPLTNDDGTVRPMSVAVGDRVLVSNHVTDYHEPVREMDGNLIMYDSDVLAILTD